MVRVKRGVMAHKRRKNVLKTTKGYRWGRKSKFRLAKEASYHAMRYSFRDRRAKKGKMRELQQSQINAASRIEGVSYSKLIKLLKDKNIELDRKVLATLAKERNDLFKKIVESAK